MDDFSQRFTNVLLKTHPNLRSSINLQDCSLVLNISAPSGNAAGPLHASSEDDEITVGFDRWHTHFCNFGGSDDDGEFERAIELIGEFLNERTIVVSVKNGDSFVRSWAQASNADPRPTKKEFTGLKLYTRSWKGTWDRT